MKIFSILIKFNNGEADLIAQDPSVCGTMTLSHCKTFNETHFKPAHINEFWLDDFYYYLMQDKLCCYVFACDVKLSIAKAQHHFRDMIAIALTKSQFDLNNKMINANYRVVAPEQQSSGCCGFCFGFFSQPSEPNDKDKLLPTETHKKTAIST